MTLLAQFAATGGGVPQYIEDVFSTWLYTGNGSTQTITNGIDLAGKGGLVWIKNRSSAGTENILTDSARGNNYISTENTLGQQSGTNAVTAFNSTGFNLGSGGQVSSNADNFVSWTFREQEKFFDVVTWTGNGSNPRTISHNLGSTPGCIIVKETNASASWAVWHRSLGDGYRMFLNSTNASTNVSAADWFGTSNSTITSTGFSVGNNLNTSGRTLVAYIFAHDAGGFGLTGSDNVISCGSYTGNGVVAGPSVTLGYEPQWVLVKSSTVAGAHWILMDNMRGMAHTLCNELYANLSAGDTAQSKTIIPTATGFNVATNDSYVNNSGSTYIYIAIRRGPMKVPTDATKVFGVQNNASTTFKTFGFPVDWSIFSGILSIGFDGYNQSRLTDNKYLLTYSTSAEQATDPRFQSNTGVADPGTYNASFARAPSFFDVVCYTGTDAGTMTHNHNLGVTPQLIIVKNRSAAVAWAVQHESFTGDNGYLVLNTTAAKSTAASWFAYAEQNTDTTFKTRFNLNTLNQNHVAYLFATCAGVSKVGSYTGTATTLQIDCGFTAGAKFVLIKRTDSTGAWYVWDTARGIVSGNDPYLLLNSSAAEVTNTDYIDTYSAGFEISSTAPAAINANGGTYIFLAIA